MKSLLRSRKFWLAVFAIVQAYVSHYLEIPPEVWKAIVALVGVLIAAIALEDTGAKLAANGKSGNGGRCC